MLRSLACSRLFAASSLATLVALGSACSNPGPAPTAQSPLTEGKSFVPIYLDGSDAAASRSAAHQALRQQLKSVGSSGTDPRTFYVAIKRDELGKKWFLSGFLKQLHPYAVLGGAAASMGTRVVTFKLQNGTLYLLDASGNDAFSDTFDPARIVDAFPVVPGLLAFTQLPGAADYVLFDPSQGLDRFTVVDDFFEANHLADARRLEVEVSFTQRYRELDDGVLFDRVFGGRTADGEAMSGTLSMALRRYSETPGFTKREVAENNYFLREVLVRKNTNGKELTAYTARWAVSPGMKPIKWYIDPRFAALAQNPRYAGVDAVGAIKRAIESWNTAFGFTVVTAEVAPAGMAFGDDDNNYVLFDSNPTPFAFADFRMNPSTGEIRGASVYLPLDFIIPVGAPSTNGDAGDAQPTAATQRRAIVWGDGAPHHLCTYDVRQAMRARKQARGAANANAPSTRYTLKEQSERYLTHVVAHEVGHTFSLRHNFKGSIVPPSSSVMDYLGYEDSLEMVAPGQYDVEALRYLHGLSATAPTPPFCTDDDVDFDADCQIWDSGANPRVDFWGAYYAAYLDAALAPPVDYTLGVLRYAQVGGTPDEQITAWEQTVARVRPVLADGTTPLPAAVVGAVWDTIIDWLLDGSKPMRYDYTSGKKVRVDALPVGALRDAIAVDLGGVVSNADGLRTISARRRAVDALRRLQTVSGLRALEQARAAIEAGLAGLSPDDRAYASDLVERIERATSPYFD